MSPHLLNVTLQIADKMGFHKKKRNERLRTRKMESIA
jgi:hypothetical protein